MENIDNLINQAILKAKVFYRNQEIQMDGLPIKEIKNYNIAMFEKIIVELALAARKLGQDEGIIASIISQPLSSRGGIQY